MLLNGGTLDGRTYLSPAAFAAMTTDHIGPGSGVARNYFYYPGDGFGFGYGFGVRTDPGNAVPPPPGSLGEIKWDGATGVFISWSTAPRTCSSSSWKIRHRGACTFK
jgi:CubicO group peptidase (beta-lactamase class C family)